MDTSEDHDQTKESRKEDDEEGEYYYEYVDEESNDAGSEGSKQTGQDIEKATPKKKIKERGKKCILKLFVDERQEYLVQEGKSIGKATEITQGICRRKRIKVQGGLHGSFQGAQWNSNIYLQHAKPRACKTDTYWSSSKSATHRDQRSTNYKYPNGTETACQRK